MNQSNTLNDMMEAYPKDVRLGVVDGRGVLFRRPSFDCDWYWGFGYLGNRDCHYHLDGLASWDWQNQAMQNKNLYDQLKIHFGDSLVLKDKYLWLFCEIVTTIYKLKDMAGVCHSGGAHYTTNPDAALLKNKEMEDNINNVLIPAQIASLYKVLADNAQERLDTLN